MYNARTHGGNAMHSLVSHFGKSKKNVWNLITAYISLGQQMESNCAFSTFSRLSLPSLGGG